MSSFISRILSGMLFVLMIGASQTAEAQFRPKKLMDKVKGGEKKEQPKQSTSGSSSSKSGSSSSSSSSNASSSTTKPDAGQSAKAKAIELQNANKSKAVAKVLLTTQGSFDDPLEKPGYYLSFTDDYTKPDKNVLHFAPNSFIYAHLHSPTPLANLEELKATSKTEYFRVYTSLGVHDKYGASKNDNKIPRKEYFKTAYSKSPRLIAVAPDKSFFQSDLESAKTNGSFPSAEAEVKALGGVLALNTSRELAYALSKLNPGVHVIEVQFGVTNKFNGSESNIVREIKGYFSIEITEESKKKYASMADMLGSIFEEYKAQKSDANSRINAEAEEKKMAAMTPEMRRAYKIATRSNYGYMDAWDGPRHNIKVVFVNRSSDVTLDFFWKDGSKPTQIGGNHSELLRQRESGTVIPVPPGTRVSVNGRVLIPSASGPQTLQIPWYY